VVILAATLLLSGASAVNACAKDGVPTLMVPDFTTIVEKANPAVVNIRTTAKVPIRAKSQQDPYDLFRFFFGPDFVPPGMFPGPGGRRTPPDRQGPKPAQPEERSVPRGLGSGFFISADGYILTNNHVISEANEILVTLTDSREFKAKVIGSDERTDIALLKVDVTNMPFLPIGDDRKIKKGQWVLAIGSPVGLDSTVTAGIISAINRDTGEYLPFIQTDVALNPGNSGGPLLNLAGEVIGINSQIISGSGGFMGISLAIPVDEVMRVVNELRRTGKVTRGRIGTVIGEVTNEVAAALGLTQIEGVANRGALVSRVESQSPAEAAGVQPGDVILKFNKKSNVRWSDLPRMVGETKPGSVAPLQVWRKGKVLTLMVKVGETLPPKRGPKKGNADKPELPASSALGLKVAPAAAGNGVRVVVADGIAASYGIEQDDIILAVNNIDIKTPEQFVQIAEQSIQLAKKADKSKPKPVTLLVRSGEQTRWVVIQIVQ
jgi:serine protease Do